jgi:lipopolysaccharide biosynthesis regulator YciM
MGRKSFASEKRFFSKSLHRDYFLGLNYLINEQPDKAVDIFIKLLDVDSDTIETHLALGSLFRKRGEVDRAIRIHQNLISRSHLAYPQRVQALHELAKDYLRAGVLDQAERLFLELVEKKQEVVSSLRFLLNIYQQQKDWNQAIVMAKKLEQAGGESMCHVIAHYHCEIAENLKKQKNYLEAEEYLKKALQIDKNCFRANLTLAAIEIEMKNYNKAINYYKEVKSQDPDYLSEIIMPLRYCYEKLNAEEEVFLYLQECLEDQPRMPVVVAISEYLQKQKGNRAAIDFLADQIRKYPSLRGLDRLIELYLTISEGDAKDKLLLLKDLVRTLLANKPAYRCQDCGFSSSNLYWICPGCKHWSSVRPLYLLM